MYNFCIEKLSVHQLSETHRSTIRTRWSRFSIFSIFALSKQKVSRNLTVNSLTYNYYIAKSGNHVPSSKSVNLQISSLPLIQQSIQRVNVKQGKKDKTVDQELESRAVPDI